MTLSKPLEDYGWKHLSGLQYNNEPSLEKTLTACRNAFDLLDHFSEKTIAEQVQTNNNGVAKLEEAIRALITVYLDVGERFNVGPESYQGKQTEKNLMLRDFGNSAYRGYKALKIIDAARTTKLLKDLKVKPGIIFVDFKFAPTIPLDKYDSWRRTALQAMSPWKGNEPWKLDEVATALNLLKQDPKTLAQVEEQDIDSLERATTIALTIHMQARESGRQIANWDAGGREAAEAKRVQRRNMRAFKHDFRGPALNGVRALSLINPVRVKKLLANVGIRYTRAGTFRPV